MSGHQRRTDSNNERRYEVDDAHARHGQESALSAGASGGGVSNSAAAEDLPAGSVETPRYIQIGGPEEGPDPDLDRDEEELDEDLLDRINANLTTSWSDWAVTDEEARNVATAIQGASPQQQELLINSMRESGQLDTFLDNLSDEDRENLTGALGNLSTANQIETLMETGFTDWAVTDDEANQAMELVQGLPLADQVQVLGEVDDATFDTFLDNLPDSSRADLQEHFDATVDPERKLKIWEVMHAGRAQDTHDASEEESPWFWERSDEDNLVRHRNDQGDSTLESTQIEIADEASVLRQRMADGEDITIEDIQALDERKRRELELESTYGLNLTNNRGNDTETESDPQSDRRVWSESELTQLEGAFTRMPEEHLRNNLNLTEIRRSDMRKDRENDVWVDSPSTGADAGGGQITFYDTGTGFDATTGIGTVKEPWRLGNESDLADHDKAEGTETSLVEEVLSHEAGHTVHQGDPELFERFQEISGWQNVDEATTRTNLKAQGLTDAEVDARIQGMNGTRESGYNSRQTYTEGDTLFEVDPYSDDFLQVDARAIPAGDEWGYARTNASDHFAEIYTKAMHAPETLYADLVAGPQQELETAEANISAAETQAQYLRDNGGTAEDIAVAEQSVQAERDERDEARAAQRVRREQWDFFRNDVFGADDSDIQALEAPPGKEAVYEEYQRQAAMAMTPQQLAGLRERFADQL